LAGLALGLALSGTLRWRRSQRRLRSLLWGLGLNLAAVGLLGAILVAGSEAGGLAPRWPSLLILGALFGVLGVLTFRFPRSVGLPVLIFTLAGAWWATLALQDFRVLGSDFPTRVVQPLTDAQTVTAFALRADFIEVPEWAWIPPLCRLRAGSSSPPEWWWPFLASRGWGRSVGTPLPVRPQKFALYRLSLTEGGPVWVMDQPESVPGPP